MENFEFKEYYKNPRKITYKEAEQLKDNLRLLGDLSGIVHNKRTDELIGGNQRSKVIDIKNCEIVLTEQYDQPTKTGTLAFGYVLWEGERYTYRLVDWDEKMAERANVTANKLGGKFDFDILANQFEFDDLLEYGFEEWELIGHPDDDDDDDDHGEPETPQQELEALQDDYEEPNQINTDIVEGDLIEIETTDGRIHRVFCGDSTRPDHVSDLFGGQLATFLHADPPYGMGKQSDGVANDNLYREKLDAFQMLWITAFLKYTKDNGSLFIWGNPEELWRLWFVGGLNKIEGLNFTSLINWVKVYTLQDKQPDAIGILSPLMRCYPPATEQALFIMRGLQEMPTNSYDYWQGWEPVRSYLAAEAKKMKWKNKQIQQICGVGMYSHWFTESQFVPIPKNQYEKLQEAAEGKAFTVDYEDIGGGINAVKEAYDLYKQSFYEGRTYFDNTHEKQTDVWHFPRVQGDDRPDHATPKPIATAERAIKSSCPMGEITAEPFLGSGTTLLAGHQIGRIIYAMELQPKYVALALDRLRKHDPSVMLLRNGEPYELKI